MRDVIVIPTYNERENAKDLIGRIFRAYPDVFILVVDDNSPDGTADAVEKLRAAFPNLSLLKRSKKAGLGEAYRDAFSRLTGDETVRSIITMDADGSHDPVYLADFFRNIDRYDFVIGSRYIKGGGVEKWAIWRKLLSRCGNIYSRVLTGVSIRDLTSGFVAYRRDFLARVDFAKFDLAGYAFAIELKFFCVKTLGGKFLETPIMFRSRREGESKISGQIISGGLKAPLKILWRRIWKK